MEQFAVMTLLPGLLAMRVLIPIAVAVLVWLRRNLSGTSSANRSPSRTLTPKRDR